MEHTSGLLTFAGPEIDENGIKTYTLIKNHEGNVSKDQLKLYKVGGDKTGEPKVHIYATDMDDVFSSNIPW